MSNRSSQPNYRVTIHYKKGFDHLFYLTKESATAAVAKLKEENTGYGDLTVEDDFGKVVDFVASDYVRAVTTPEG